MKRESMRIRAGLALIVFLLAAQVASVAHLPMKATAAPSLTDLGTGNKTVSWDFSDPADYSRLNVSSSDPIALGQSSSALVQDSNLDFIANGTFDALNLTIAGGAISNRLFAGERIANGSFQAPGPWGYDNGTDPNTRAFWDQPNETGRFTHDRPATPALHFDELDTGAGTNWTLVMGGAPSHNVPFFGHDTAVYFEWNASIRFDVDFKNSLTSWLGMERTGTFDWSAYNTFSAWTNTTYSGPTTLQCYLHLEQGATMWDSPPIAVAANWSRLDFPLAGFPGNLAALSRVSVRFANVRNVNGVSIWTDDLWLYRFESFNPSPAIFQDFTKRDFTDPIPNTVMLTFDYNVSSPLNLTTANLTAKIDGTLWSSPNIPADASTGWTRAGPYDISAALTGRGAFNLSFEVDFSLYTPFATYLDIMIDNVSLTVPEYHNGSYLSVPFDLGSAVFFDNISFSASSHPDTNVTVSVRGGWSNDTSDGSWSGWERHFSTPGILLNKSIGGFIQFMVTLNTTNESAPVSFDMIAFAFHMYGDEGSVRTVEYSAPDTLIGWRWFEATYASVQSTSVEFYVSDDNGSNWYIVQPASSISFLAGNNISIMAELSTSNSTRTPVVSILNATYEFQGPLYRIIVSPATWAGTSDAQVPFTARAWDQWWHPIPSFVPNWTEDDPVGDVDQFGLYRPGMAGDWHVCASSLGVIDCANVTVSHGDLWRIAISPPSALVPASTTKRFDASGFDSDDNPVPLTATQWNTDAGTFDFKTQYYAIFNASGVPMTGQVSVAHDSPSGPVLDQAAVQVTASTAVAIQGIVPNQRYPEDSPPWQLDLTTYLPSGLDPDDLMWYLEGKNDSLYSVLGERRFGQQVLVFSPKKDACGDNHVTLWLEDRAGAKDPQALTVTLTPVNDGPVFYDVPKIQVKADRGYSFDYSPYILDVDTDKNMLILSTDDPSHTKVTGLSVNYTYDSSNEGKQLFVKLRISDAQASSSTIQILSIVGGSNAAPHMLKPLPDVVMSEDVTLDDTFPEVLSNYFGDADGDVLTYSVSYSPHISVQLWTTPPSSIHARMIPAPDWNGETHVVIRANDSGGLSAEQSVRATVTPVNDPPVISWRDDIYVKYDVPYDLDLTDYVGDVDNPPSQLALSSDRPDFATFTGFRLRLLLPGYLFGTITSVPLSLKLTDGLLSDWSNVTVSLGTNEPPVLTPDTSLPDVTFDEDTQLISALDLDVYFMDIDGPQPLTYTLTSTYVAMSIDSRDNSVNFSAPLNWNGQDVVHVKAYDGVGFVMGRFVARVLPVDDAPVIDDIPDQDLDRGGLVAIDLRDYVHDVDNNISELRFTTDSDQVTAIGYILVLDFRSGGDSVTVNLTANDTQKQAQITFDVILHGLPPGNGNGGMPLWAQIAFPGSILALVVALVAGLVVYNRVLDRRYPMEDAFLMGKGERLIMHTTRHLRADRDEDTLARMLTATQAFIRDSFKDEGDMRGFRFSDWEVLVQKGRSFYLAAIFSAEPPESATENMRNFAADIDSHFGPVLDVWSGEADEVRGLRSFMDAFVAHRKYSRGDWKKVDKKRRNA